MAEGIQKQPLFSVVIANYNYGRFLEEAIQSVLSQSCQDFELIIVDGGSTDNSVEVIKKYADRISWWISEKDRGQSDAFNKGFAHANGRFLTWLNADDAFAPGALSAVAREIERHADCEWFVGSSVWCDAEMRIDRCFCAHRFSALRAKTGGMTVGGPSSFFTQRLLDAVGGVDESLHYVMDVDLWYKFHRECGAKYRRTCHNVWAFRQHEASKMSGSGTERALANRRRSQEESRLMDRRYGRKGGWQRRLLDLLSFSLIDKIVAVNRTKKYKGKSLRALKG